MIEAKILAKLENSDEVRKSGGWLNSWRINP